MLVEQLMDLALTATEGVFGRPVSYVSPSGGAAVEICGEYRETHEAVDLGGQVDASLSMPVLDCREATLTAAGVVPRQGATVSFEVFGEQHTYTVQDVRRPASGTVLLLLGDRS